MSSLADLVMTLPTLRAAYQGGGSVHDVVAEVRRRIDAVADNPIWISLLDDQALSPILERLQRLSPNDLPLYGVPFAIKDNIDLEGIATTAACEAFSYIPDESAFVVSVLIEAGAIPIGKTNLDQFATGLVGTRSPYGEVRCAFDTEYISGGSSAGSAVSVALGQVCFALGTDTAGSGRVPAAFNNLVGYKPTRGLLSTRGVVPACRTLDCVSIFSMTVHDAERVGAVVERFDSQDEWARASVPAASAVQVIGVPKTVEFGDNKDYADCFARARERFAGMDVTVVDVDCEFLLEAARLLYEGAWVAERYHAARELIESNPAALREEFVAIAGPARDLTAVDYFDGAYRLAKYRRQAESMFAGIDALLMPTTPAHFTRREVADEPLLRNAELGTYTNFMNLLDLCGVAVPSGFTAAGMPFGVTLIGDRFTDTSLLEFARSYLSSRPRRLGATGDMMSEPMLVPSESETMAIAVCGAHLSGMPLNTQLTERGATLREATSSAANYRLFALPGGPPFRPGMVRVEGGGAAIEVEVWDVPVVHVGSFLGGIPAPLGLGKIELASGEWVSGFICEPCGIDGAEDITHLGGWRAYMATRR